MKTSGNTVLITGGATGIGLALAEALVERGNSVIICGRRRRLLEKVRSRLPSVHTRSCDVTSSKSRTSLVGWLERHELRPNILVNNAGIQRTFDFLAGRRDLRAADAEIATNLAAPVQLCALLIPLLRRKRSAAIVNISSGLGFAPKADVCVYSATKAAIHSLSLSLRHQLRNTPIRVFEIIPPLVATDLQGDRRQPAGGHVMTPAAVAAGIMDALEHDRFEAAFGTAAGAVAKRDELFSTINRE